MKTIYLLRHAKSDWSNETLADFDRPLNSRGEHNAPLMGQVMHQHGIAPDLILSSPANRTRTTAQLIAPLLGYAPQNIRFERAIYEASVPTLARLLSQQDDAYASVMLVGHNPGLTELANQLGGPVTDNVPTAGVVGIDFPIDHWGEILHSTGQLLFFWYPKQFK